MDPLWFSTLLPQARPFLLINGPSTVCQFQGRLARRSLISGASSSSAGRYTCTAINSAGSATSAAATLVVSSTPDIGRLVNISCRAQVGIGAISSSPDLLWGERARRARSRSLPVPLARRLCRLASRARFPTRSFSWIPAQRCLAAMTAGPAVRLYLSRQPPLERFPGATPPATTPRYCSCFPPARIRSSSPGKAETLALRSPKYTTTRPRELTTPSDPRIVNISARVQVGTGGNVLIAGFVIGGSTSRTVLIRASGPALIPFGVTGTLPDPMLQLSSGSNSYRDQLRMGR